MNELGWSVSKVLNRLVELENHSNCQWAMKNEELSIETNR